MSSQYWSTVISMADTTAFRAWGAEIKAKMAAAGAVQTADTGQIGWATVSRPATANTIGGYEIWKTPDSTIFWKLEYWTGVTTVTNAPAFYLTVGTGSDGAGAITGQSSTRTYIGGVVRTLTPATPYSSYCYCTNDYFVLAHKVGGSTVTGAVLGFMIEKFVDVAGAVTTDGFVVRTMPNATASLQNVQAVRTASPAQTFAVNTAFCLVTGNATASAIETGDNQVYLHSHQSPRGIFSNFSCTVIVAEVPLAMTFSSNLVGASARTLIGLGTALGCGNSVSAAATWGTAGFWVP